MDDKDYAELRMRLVAHQTLLCAVLASNQDKARLSGFVVEALDQMKSLHLASRLGDDVLEVFDQEIQSILKKAGITVVGG